jgi:hypothetical protein
MVNISSLISLEYNSGVENKLRISIKSSSLIE